MRDIDVRRSLLKEVKRLHLDEPDTRFVQELGLCQGLARVDLAVVNGSVHGYEIKSERDTLNRLQSQSESYSQALEFVTIVAAPDHLMEIDDIVPKWWGIWKATHDNPEVTLEVMRESLPNPSLVPLALAQFLWRDEVLAILEEHHLASGMGNKSRNHLWTVLTNSFNVNELSDFVRSNLKQRGPDWRSHA